MAISKVFRNGGSFVFVLKRNIVSKYKIKLGDTVDYLLKAVVNKNPNINELVEGVKVRNISSSMVVRIPMEIVQVYNIEEGDSISYDVVR